MDLAIFVRLKSGADAAKLRDKFSTITDKEIEWKVLGETLVVGIGDHAIIGNSVVKRLFPVKKCKKMPDNTRISMQKMIAETTDLNRDFSLDEKPIERQEPYFDYRVMAVVIPLAVPDFLLADVASVSMRQHRDKTRYPEYLDHFRGM
jgi:hypothetical protein